MKHIVKQPNGSQAIGPLPEEATDDPTPLVAAAELELTELEVDDELTDPDEPLPSAAPEPADGPLSSPAEPPVPLGPWSSSFAAIEPPSSDDEPCAQLACAAGMDAINTIAPRRIQARENIFAPGGKRDVGSQRQKPARRMAWYADEAVR